MAQTAVQGVRCAVRGAQRRHKRGAVRPSGPSMLTGIRNCKGPAQGRFVDKLFRTPTHSDRDGVRALSH